MNDFLEKLENFALSGGVELVRGITIILLGYMIIKVFVRYLKGKINKNKNIDKTLPNFIISLVNILLMAVLVIYALVLIGISLDSVVTIASVISLGVSLALQDTISSFANGIIIIVTKPFVEGEYVSFASTGKEGNIASITMFNCVMKTADGLMVTIPNSTITKDSITNYSRLPTRKITISLPVSYKTDIDLLRKVTIETVMKDKRVLEDPYPVVVLTGYGDSNLNYSMRCWTHTDDYWDTLFTLSESILRAYRENNISFDYAQYEVSLKQINVLKQEETKHE